MGAERLPSERVQNSMFSAGFMFQNIEIDSFRQFVGRLLVRYAASHSKLASLLFPIRFRCQRRLRQCNLLPELVPSCGY
jgi:hypothetical protein